MDGRQDTWQQDRWQGRNVTGVWTENCKGMQKGGTKETTLWINLELGLESGLEWGVKTSVISPLDTT